MYATDAELAMWHYAKSIWGPAVDLGGITGNEQHVEDGGYHDSRTILLSHGMGDDYSLQHRRDRLGGDDDAASAIDLTMYQTPLMHTVANRLLAAAHARDPRMAPIREFFTCQRTNGPIVGWDFSYGGPSTSLDLSHREHHHLSIWRDQMNNTAALLLVIDVMAGNPLNTYIIEGII